MAVIKRRAPKIVEPELEEVELTTKLVKAGTWRVSGNGEYTVTLQPGGFFQVKEGKEIINPKIKGFSNVEAWIAEYDAEDEDEEEDEEEEEPVKTTPVRMSKTTPAKTKPFPSFETWIGAGEGEAEKYHQVKTRRESQVDYDKQLRTAKMRYGLLKSKYEKAGGVDTTKKAQTKEERFGVAWHDFGAADPLAYELSRVRNARASVEYSIEHGKMHPHSPIAQGSLYKALERLYESEARLALLVDGKLPKGYSHQLYSLTLDDIRESDEAMADVLEQYIEFYAQNSSGKTVRRKMDDGTFQEIPADGYTLLPIVEPEPVKPVRRKK